MSAIIKEPYIGELDLEKNFRYSYIFKFVNSDVNINKSFTIKSGHLYEFNENLNGYFKDEILFREVNTSIYYKISLEDYKEIANEKIFIYLPENERYVVELEDKNIRELES
jgi:hypothetical protein